MLLTVEFELGPAHEVVVAGKSETEDTKRMLEALRRPFLPNKVVLFRGIDATGNEIESIAPYTKQQLSLDGKATAYVCVNHGCQMPTTEPAQMLQLLGTKNP